jgi:hypothetical protein
VRGALAAGAFAAAIACVSPSAPGAASAPAPELGRPVTLATGESASFDSGKISVRFVAVAEDSRCPKNEQCVWAGNARVELEVTAGGSGARTIALDTNKGTRDAEIEGYAVSLEDVAPLPVSGRGIAPEQYRVTLVVRRGSAPSRSDQPVR